MPGLQFYIELIGSNPKVWRRIVVPYEYTFYKFHLAIQGAFGWENYHLFQFCENGFLDKISYREISKDDIVHPDFIHKDAKRSKIKLIFNRDKKEFIYIYDLGSKWTHHIINEALVDEEIERPYCVDGAGACPPEDCGGFAGYANMLISLNDPNHPDRKNNIEILGLQPGEELDPEFCSVREVNKRLCLLE